MSGNGLKLAIGACVAATGLGLLASTSSPERPEEKAVLALPAPPSQDWGSGWVPGAMPQPPAEGEISGADSIGEVNHMTGMEMGTEQQSGPVEDPYAG